MTVNKITSPPSQKGVIDKINEVIDNLGGGGVAPVWGNITGTLSDQTDLQNALTLKADVDFDNAIPSASFKNTSISWMMPDYSLAVSKAWNTTHTADVDGWLYVSVQVAGNGNQTADLLINNITVAWNACYWNDVETHSQFVPVAKGSTYIARGGQYGSLSFFPCKGGS